MFAIILLFGRKITPKRAAAGLVSPYMSPDMITR
jgi:hypothetical protein